MAQAIIILCADLSDKKKVQTAIGAHRKSTDLHLVGQGRLHKEVIAKKTSEGLVGLVRPKMTFECSGPGRKTASAKA